MLFGNVSSLNDFCRQWNEKWRDVGSVLCHEFDMNTSDYMGTLVFFRSIGANPEIIVTKHRVKDKSPHAVDERFTVEWRGRSFTFIRPITNESEFLALTNPTI